MQRGLLARPPTDDDLARVYHELARLGAPAVGRRAPWPYRAPRRERLLALAAEMSRYDARLLSILLELLVTRWRDANPVWLRDEMHRMRWPQALCVVLEFAKAASRDAELAYFVDYLQRGWGRVDRAERFAIGGERPGSRMAARHLGRNLAAYGRWGFIGTERPTWSATGKQVVGRYDATTRRAILGDLLARQPTLRLADYLDAVDHTITRQQALADLRAHEGLRPIGRGRGARWQLTAGA